LLSENQNDDDGCSSLFSSSCGIHRRHEQLEVEHVLIALAQLAREQEYMILQDKPYREPEWMIPYWQEKMFCESE
jgi:hypothetical protein